VVRKFFLSLLFSLAFQFSLPAWLAAFEPVSSRMTERLYDSLAYGSGDQFLEVIVYLQDDLDIYALDHSLRLAAAGKKKRHSEVVGAMLASAGKAQAPLLEILEEAKKSGDVLSYRAFWVNNCVAFTGRAAFISALSARDEIEWMTHDRVYSRSDPVEHSTEIFALAQMDTLRTLSYPIQTLGLDQIWDLGLTGKGILVCALGSGIDGSHPLLGPKWRGNNGGTATESWFDPVEGTTFPFDDEPNTPTHGTGVMGIMVAGERSLGVAYEAQWIGAKIFDNQNLTDEGRSTTKDSWIISAFQWATDPDGNPETTVDAPDVINNSWGTVGEYNEDICRQVVWLLLDRVEATGAVVVFSAGNEGPEPWTIGSPASRADSPLNAFAVGAVDSGDWIAPFSSRGPSACDSAAIKPNVCAPGSGIVTIVGSPFQSSYMRVGGTSFSSPYVAGIIALIKQANPLLSPDEIKQLIIDTAIDYGVPGPDYAYGYGVMRPVSIFNELAVPDRPFLYTKRVEIDDQDGGNGNSYLEQGERIRLTVPVFNSGVDVSGVSGTIRTSNSGVVMIDSTASFGSIPRFGGSANGDDPFVFDILPEAPSGSQLLFYLDLSSADGSFHHSLQLTLPIAPAVEGIAYLDAGSFLLSITNYGQFGGNIGRTDAGQGLRYPKDAPYTMLYRGALILGTSSLKVSDGIRDFDFAPGPGGPIKIFNDSPRADQMTEGYIREKTEGSLNAIGVRIKQTTLTWREHPDNDFAVFEYKVHNPHPATINNLYVGLYADWDIPDSLPSRNAVGYQQAMKMGYIYNPQETQFGYGGLALISDHPVSGHRAVSNWRYIHEGYSDNVAFAFMSGGLTRAASDSLEDWSQILATGPHSIPPGDTLTLAWALLVGDDLADLTVNAQAARTKYHSSLLAASDDKPGSQVPPALPKAYSLAQNVPNPFNPSTTISYSLPGGDARHVRLTVFDLRGRKVIGLVNRVQPGGAYSVIWNGIDSHGRPVPSGVYFYRLEAGDFKAVRKMVVLK